MDKRFSSNEQAALDCLEEVFQAQEEGGEISVEDEENVLAIIRDYPTLALQSIVSSEGYGILPLEFLLKQRASLSTIRKFCMVAPSAPCPTQQKNLWWSLPLHKACEIPTTPPGVIPYLVERYPKAASYKNMHEKRPIDYLLGRKSSLEDIQSLLRVLPPTTVSDQNGLLQAAFDGPNKKDILEYVVDQCPKVIVFLAEKLPNLCLDRAQALTRLLPQLESFRFRSKIVELTGWQHLMISLGKCESIQRLHLDTERTIGLGDNGKALGSALSSMRKLLDLTVLGPRRFYSSPSNNNRERNTYMDTMTEALVILLGRNTLESIRIQDIPLRHEAIFEVLKHDNTSLRRMYIVGCVDSNKKRNDLVDVLLTNTSLQDIPIRSYGGDAATYEMIDYWTKLNRSGRRTARNPRTSLKKFVSVLHDANLRNGVSSRDQDHPTQLARAQVLYGLLRECPSIWCE